MKLIIDGVETEIDVDSIDIKSKVIKEPPPPVEEPATFSINWGNAPASGELKGIVTFKVTGALFENVELVPAGKYDPKYGIVTLAADKKSATIVLDTTKLVEDGTYNLVVVAFDKPAGQPASEVRTDPRNWTINNGGVPEEPPVVTLPTDTILVGTGPTINSLTDTLDQAPLTMPVGQGPKNWKRWIFDDFRNGFVEDNIDAGLRGYWKKFLTYGTSVRRLNDEQEYYTWKGDKGGSKPDTIGTSFDPFPVIEKNGKKYLAITGRLTSAEDMSAGRTWGMHYQSGLIANWNKGNQTYGYFEAKLIVPDVKGVWPAFWLMNGDGPGNLSDVWPPEIDILEWPNGADARNSTVPYNRRAFTNVHWKDASTGSHKSTGGWVDTGAIVTGPEPVHYGCLWTKNYVAFYHNGKRTKVVANNGLHLPMHVVFNLALGGNWPGTIEDPKLPCLFLITDFAQWKETS